MELFAWTAPQAEREEEEEGDQYNHLVHEIEAGLIPLREWEGG